MFLNFVLIEKSLVSLVLTCCSMCFQRHMRRSFINDKNSGELALEYIIEWGVTAGLSPCNKLT